ncbi:class I SAM-dependent methyltransferase [Chitinophaga nivalis]|uniref:Class I SAM-dependent methyltransferase n=1 Tax=Chitinophaga nivalis TaxID=2991709 RepID=A0ABT3IH38_9BACT|nr:class I SAM-dependent methyltransferase [Chitinophaga nivalis]MCW3467026.1 class I SAM-dependent methyltransferase [Chitinophaga nivalis]MCW3483283.1 class I SAM-dependent methyltransferase [Chitinophaga nivalis]
MEQKWNERYKDQEFVYGKAPNLFFETWLPEFKPGRILMPADGEGRNGVFAARLGWQVTSADLSVEGKSKALQLAAEQQVTLNYLVGDMAQLHFEPASFDAIGLIYAHFSADKKSILHRQLNTWLKPGGIIIFEAFSKKHLPFRKENPRVGGPEDIDMLFSLTEIVADFDNYEILVLEEAEILLEEGKYHIGKGSVIRFVGRKLR